MYTLTKTTDIRHEGLSASSATLVVEKNPSYRDARGYWNITVDGNHLTAFKTLRQVNGYLSEMYGEKTTPEAFGFWEQNAAEARAKKERAQAQGFDAEERAERDLLEKVQTGTVLHADIAGATFVGTMSQIEMARLVRMLGTYIADATEQNVRVHTDAFGHMHFSLGDGVSSATIDLTDSAVHIKGA